MNSLKKSDRRMNCLYFERTLFILCLVNCIPQYQGLDFCSDMNNITKMFTLGNTTYLQKGNLFYKTQIENKFEDQKSYNKNILFGSGMTSNGLTQC